MIFILILYLKYKIHTIKVSNLLSNTFYKFRIYSHNLYGISSYLITNDSLKTL